ncbi:MULTISPECIES: DUF2627 domain-containing protein [Paenibacillus]|uniref:DUF2627 domain-containing protein n=1 Tax=Paenibacillus TaxID=44249 RepID=UPI000838F7F7|nr:MULTISPECIES: DUF2627 domain-containing protein [Paenibacillus]GIP20192.1 hypothetical protein J22TS3_04670 [Paenibacillus sp. J22TS3]
MNTRILTARFIAVLILVIPGIIAMTGFLFMKDALFEYMYMHGDDSLTRITFDWLHFALGLIMFLAGISFLGGWIFFRDRKRGYVGPRFKETKNKKRPPDPSA